MTAVPHTQCSLRAFLDPQGQGTIALHGLTGEAWLLEGGEWALAYDDEGFAAIVHKGGQFHSQWVSTKFQKQVFVSEG
eukprot:15473741-Alexandrium_andersonii.AAC.1